MSEDWRKDPRFSNIELSEKEIIKLKKNEVNNIRTTNRIRSILMGIISIIIILFFIARSIKFLS